MVQKTDETITGKKKKKRKQKKKMLQTWSLCCFWCSFYLSRADTFLRRGTGDVSMIEESQNLSLFLANQHKITHMLKDDLVKIPGYEDVLADVLNLCVKLYEGHMYITPNDKYILLKVI